MYKYYVYGHYTDDGELFYIGKGTGDRAFQTYRNDDHLSVSEMYGCNPKILIHNLNQEEAELIETQLIIESETIGYKLTNKNLYRNVEPADNQTMLNLIMKKVENNYVSNIIYFNKPGTIKVDKSVITKLKALNMVVGLHSNLEDMLIELITEYEKNLTYKELTTINAINENLNKKIQKTIYKK